MRLISTIRDYNALIQRRTNGPYQTVKIGLNKCIYTFHVTEAAPSFLLDIKQNSLGLWKSWDSLAIIGQGIFYTASANYSGIVGYRVF